MALTMLQQEARAHRATERERLGVLRGAELREQVERFMAPIRAYAEGFKMGGWAHRCSVCGWKYTRDELEACPIARQSPGWTIYECVRCPPQPLRGMAVQRFQLEEL